MIERMKSLIHVSENIYLLTAEGALIKSFGKRVSGLFKKLIWTNMYTIEFKVNFKIM